MEEDGGGPEWTRSRREGSDVSGGAAVRISKDYMRFAKAAEQNFSTEIFMVTKVIDRHPRVVYEHEVLNGIPIDAQFYREELTPVRITERTSYKIDKTGQEGQTRHSRYLVRWRGYNQEFDSWVPAGSVKNI